MPLKTELEKLPETIQEFEFATEARYFEGLELMLAGRPGAGIYLIGYAAEMLLKTAYFLLTGARPMDLVQPRLVPALRTAQVLIPNVAPEGYHSVRFWSLLLLETRSRSGRPLADRIEAPFRQRTRRLYQNWWVSMRYRRDLSQPTHLRSVYDDVSWLRANYARLWR